MIDINSKIKIVGQLYPDGIQGPGFDVVATFYRKGVLVADTPDDRRIACAHNSPWVFISAVGEQDEVKI